MSTERLRNRVAELQLEIKSLRDAEILYKRNKLHTVEQDETHEIRLARIQEILTELAAIKKQPCSFAA